MEEYLTKHSTGQVVEDTGNELLCAKADGPHAWMYTFPGGELAAGHFDPIEEHHAMGAETDNLAFLWVDVDDETLHRAYEAMSKVKPIQFSGERHQILQSMNFDKVNNTKTAK